MISVPNHPQRLNGNKVFPVLSFIIFFIFSCGTSRKTTVVKPGVKIIPKDTNVVKNRLPEKIDTILWKEIKIEPTKMDPSDKLEEKNVKALTQLNMLALIPFNSDEIDTAGRTIPFNNLRFVQYYAGMKMAVNEFKKQKGIPINLKIFDTGGKENLTDEFLSNDKNETPDLIIGPYNVETLKRAALFVKDQKRYLISPWISSSTIASENPYYFQAKAGLNTHFQLINDHVRARFPFENILLIARSKEDSKIRFFNGNVSDSRFLKEEIISETDLSDRPEPILEKYFMAEGPTVFILPFPSMRDENYVYHFLRRVITEKKNKTVYIYGLYKWLEMKFDILEYISQLDVRLSISNFVENNRPEVKEFKKKYFELYKEFPSEDAMEGYDLTKYLIRAINEKGRDFFLFQDPMEKDYLETQFWFKPINKESSENNTNTIDYYENSYIRMVEFKESKIKIID